jgi:hypothetical protein
MREGSPKKLSLSEAVTGSQSEAKSLFRNILDLNSCGSIFCPYTSYTPSRQVHRNKYFSGTVPKKLRYRFPRHGWRNRGFAPGPCENFRRPFGARFQSERTLRGAGSAGLLSSAPTGLVKIPARDPRLYAVGCILSPLRGFRLVRRSLRDAVPSFCVRTRRWKRRAIFRGPSGTFPRIAGTETP